MYNPVYTHKTKVYRYIPLSTIKNNHLYVFERIVYENKNKNKKNNRKAESNTIIHPIVCCYKLYSYIYYIVNYRVNQNYLIFLENFKFTILISIERDLNI